MMITTPAWIGNGAEALVSLVVISALFAITHFGLATQMVRDALVSQLGETGYRVFYSALATALLILMILAYRASPAVPLSGLGGPGINGGSAIGPTITAIVQPIATILMVGGLTMPNPLAVGGGHHLDEPKPIIGVLRITRHPVLWSVILWSVSHIVAIATTRSLILFGVLALVALAGSMTIDQKTRRRRGAAFAPVELSSSNLPFLAIIQGRQSLPAAAREFGTRRLALVVAVYAITFFGHGWAFGVAPSALP